MPDNIWEHAKCGRRVKGGLRGRLAAYHDKISRTSANIFYSLPLLHRQLLLRISRRHK